jgi:hypothetical protein
MSPEAYALALATGIVFGVITHWLWCWSAGKVAAVLFLVWIVTTFAQQMLRIFQGLGEAPELIDISTLRLAQGIAAVMTAAVLHRRCD